MTVNKATNNFILHFSKIQYFTIDDINAFYKVNEPDLNFNTLRWRIHKLRSDGLITIIKKGVYSFQKGSTWTPAINNSTKSVYKKIEKSFFDLDFMIWSTVWLNEFTNLQAFRHLIIIEVEKDFTQSVFDYIKESGLKNIYLQPDKKEINYYLSDVIETYVIKAMISKSPFRKVDKIKIPILEKILVDLFCEKELLHAFQGSEMKKMFAKAFNTYSINNSTLLNYARRRNKEKEIKEFIITNTDIKSQLI